MTEKSTRKTMTGYSGSQKMLKEKQCNKCKKILPISQFNAGKSYNDGYQYTCKECQKKFYKERYATDQKFMERKRRQAKEYCKKHYDPKKDRNKKLTQQYGITINDYTNILEGQNNVCDICGNSVDAEPLGVLAVDHCHRTDIVRGLLCCKCNMGLGAFGDDIDVMASAISYLINSKLKKVI